MTHHMEINKKIYKLVYDVIDVAVIREPESVKAMKAIKVKNIIEGFDSMPIYIEDKYHRHGIKEHKTLLVAGSVIFGGAAKLESDGLKVTTEGELIFKKFIAYLKDMKSRGYRLKFIYGAKANTAEDDKILAQYFKQKLPEIDIIFIPDEDKWLGEIEKADIFVSGRFHHTIAASCLGTKFIALNSNTPKITGMLKSTGLGVKNMDYQNPKLTELLIKMTKELEVESQEIVNSNSVKLCSILKQKALKNYTALDDNMQKIKLGR